VTEKGKNTTSAGYVIVDIMRDIIYRTV